jgi:hypothetical protein
MIVLGLLPCALLVKREPGELGLSVDGATVPEAVAKSPLTAEEGVHAVASEGHELWQLDKALKSPTVLLANYYGSQHLGSIYGLLRAV